MNEKLTLGEIVLKYPNTIKVMNKYKLDYCCGGHDTLEDAVEKGNLGIDIIKKDLEEVINKQNLDEVKNWKEESLSNIIDYILTKHHTFMRETLDELNVIVFKILKVHYHSHGDSLLKIHHLFGTLKTELEEHLVKEEENLFPKIKKYEMTKDENLREEILQIISDTEDEHDVAGDIFKQLDTITNGYKAPDDGCTTFDRTYHLLDALEKDTFNHIHMENSVLFTML